MILKYQHQALQKRTMGTYGYNRLGDLLNQIQNTFDKENSVVIDYRTFVNDNPDIPLQDFLVACTLRNYFVEVCDNENAAVIWLSKEVYEVIWSSHFILKQFKPN